LKAADQPVGPFSKEFDMQLTKTLTSVIAATGMVGVIGLAYAQATTDPAQTTPPATSTTPSTTTMQPGDPATSATTTPPTSATTPAAPMATDSAPSTTLEPQADRN
jgi:hypothetical protein